jgi:hypothetical protein
MRLCLHCGGIVDLISLVQLIALKPGWSFDFLQVETDHTDGRGARAVCDEALGDSGRIEGVVARYPTMMHGAKIALIKCLV